MLLNTDPSLPVPISSPWKLSSGRRLQRGQRRIVPIAIVFLFVFVLFARSVSRRFAVLDLNAAFLGDAAMESEAMGLSGEAIKGLEQQGKASFWQDRHVVHIADVRRPRNLQPHVAEVEHKNTDAESSAKPDLAAIQSDDASGRIQGVTQSSSGQNLGVNA